MPEVGHDVAVLPPALDGPGTAQVGGGWRPVVHCAQQMSELVSRHDDPGESPCVFYNGNAVDLLKTLVHDTSPAHVGEAGRASVTVSIPSLPSRFRKVLDKQRKIFLHPDQKLSTQCSVSAVVGWLGHYRRSVIISRLLKKRFFSLIYS